MEYDSFEFGSYHTFAMSVDTDLKIFLRHQKYHHAWPRYINLRRAGAMMYREFETKKKKRKKWLVTCLKIPLPRKN